jgi:hypothetical protein
MLTASRSVPSHQRQNRAFDAPQQAMEQQCDQYGDASNLESTAIKQKWMLYFD